jgi:hypothetical protein
MRKSSWFEFATGMKTGQAFQCDTTDEAVGDPVCLKFELAQERSNVIGEFIASPD